MRNGVSLEWGLTTRPVQPTRAIGEVISAMVGWLGGAYAMRGQGWLPYIKDLIDLL